MKILMSGTTGLVGSALTESLFGKGHQLHALHRQKNSIKENDSLWDTENLAEDFDAVIHLAGENIASGRWSKRKKEAIYKSRIKGTRDLVYHIAKLPKKPKVFLCASAIGYYGNRDQEFLSEKSDPGSGFLADLCQQWEKEARRLIEWDVRVVHLRFGMILSAKGGALHKMLAPFRKKIGGVLGSGQQCISWVSLYDVVESIDFILKNDAIEGPVNITSPHPVTNQEFTRILAKELGVPAFFNMPAGIIKIIFGEMGKELLLSSAKVIPKVLDTNKYNFTDTDLATTLRACIEKDNHR